MAKRGMSAGEARVRGYPLHAASAVQGYQVTIRNVEDAARWVANEIDYWRGADFATHETEGALAIWQIYVARLEKIDTSNSYGLKQYFDQAEKLGVVVGASRLGQALLEVRQWDPRGAAALVAALTENLQSDIAAIGIDYRRAVKAGLVVGPAMLAARGINDLEVLEARSKTAVEEYEQARDAFGIQIREVMQSVYEDHAGHADDMAKQRQELTAFVSGTEAELTRIRELYHKHVQVEAAATYWSDRANAAWQAGAASLAAFIAMVIVPLGYAFFNLEAIKDFVMEIGTTSQGQLSLTPLVAITVPVLAYGWILRHVSRLFIQSFAQSDDARYRNVMTMTFLGLSKDEKSGVTDTERGIIMNALFRPSPPNAAEDGPPIGLLDLIKGGKQ
nr:DUF6161 domain-containing protein [uncultured Devosia sp.]